MVRIKPKWLLGAMVALLALVALPAAALAEAPTGVNIVSPTNTSKAAVAAGNNVYVTFNYTSVPMEANTTSATIQVVDPATSTVVGERTYAYPAIQDTGPDGAQFTGNVTIDSGAAEGKYDVVVTVTNHDGSASDTETEAVIVDNSDPNNVTSVTAPPYTNDTTPTFTWVAPDDNGTPPSGIAGYRVGIWLGSTCVRGPYTGVTDENSVLDDVQWTLPDADALPPGSYEVRVWAVDRAANESANPGTDSFIIDTTAPVLDQQGPTGYTKDDTPTLTVRFRDLGAGASGYDATNSPLSFTLDDGPVLPPTHNPLDGALVDSITKDVAPAITQGDHTAYIKVQDRAGNTAELTWNFFVDSVAPNGPASVTAPEYTADSTPDFYWPVAEDNGPLAEQSGVGTYTVEIWSTGGGAMLVRGPYTGVTDGNPATPEVDWTLPDALSVDGEYEIRVYSVDNAGNTSTSYASDTFKLDTTSPTLDWEQPANGSWTSDTTPPLSVRFRDTGAGASGYDQAASPTAFTLDGSPLGDPDSEPADGSVGPAYITKGVTTALGDGAHTVSITVEDRVGNSRTYGWTFNVDNTPPSTPTNVTLPDATPDPTPPPAYWTNDSTPKFQWDEATDTGGSGVASYDVEIWVSGGASAEKTYTGVTDQDGGTPGVQWTIPDALTEEIYEVRVYSVDVAGNRSTGYGSTTFGVDITTNPLMLDQESPRDGSFINDATPLLAVRFRDLGYPASGYDADDSPTSFTLDGSPLGDPDTEPNAGDTLGYITKQITSDLGQGSHVVYIAVEDLAGNSANLTWDFFVDTTPPNAPTGVTAQDPTNDPTPAFSWDLATDPGEGAVPPTGSGVGSYKVEIWSGGARILGPYTAMTDESGDPGFQWALPDPLPADGAYEIRVWSVDKATNVSETYGSDTFKFDTTPPVLDNEMPTGYINNASPTLSVRFTDSGAGASGYDETWSPNVFELNDVNITPPGSEPGNGALTGNITKNVGPLAEAQHKVEITVRDLAQNVASLTWYFTVDLTAPNPPGSVTAPEFTNDTTPTFTWTAGSDTGSGIASYIVEVWTTGGGAAKIRGPYTGITGLTFTVPNSDAISPDGDYEVRVWSVDRAGNVSATYTADGFQLDTGKPTLMNGAPTGLLNSLQVTFTADYADDRSGFAIVPPLNPWMRYQDANDGATWTSVPAITGPSVGALTGQIKGESWPGTPITLPNDGRWTVRLTAYDRAGNNTDNPDPYSWTFTVDTTPPTFSNPYPAEETTTWDKWTEIHVKITDPLAGDGSPGSGVDGGSLECYIDGPGIIPWDLQLESWDPATGEAVFVQPIGLDLADGTYAAHVSAADVAGNFGTYVWVFEIRQAYAPGMNALPEFTSDTSVTVSWSDVDNEQSYEVQSSFDPAFETIDETFTLPADSSSQVFTPGDGVKAYFRVRAVAYGGRTSLWSNVVFTTCDESAPTGLSVTALPEYHAGTGVRLDWVAATDAGSGVAGYILECTDTFEGGATIVGTAGPEATTYEFSGLEIGKVYSFRMKAVDNAGNESEWVSFGSTELQEASLCAPQISEIADWTKGGSVSVAWNAIDAHGTFHYVFESSTTADFSAGVVTVDPATSPQIVTGTDGQTKWFRVKAVNNVTDSGWSGVEYTTFDLTAPTDPAVTTVAAYTGGTGVRLNWQSSTDEGSGIAGYVLECTDTAPEGETIVGTAGPEATTYEFSGLEIGKVYSFRIKALDNVGYESEWVSFGSTELQEASLCAPQISEIADWTKGGSVSVAWNAIDAHGTFHYVFESSTTADFSAGVVTVDPATSPQIVTGTDGQTKWFRVKAVNNVTDSGWSGVEYTTFDTQAPAGLAAVTDLPEYHAGTGVRLDWEGATDSASGVARYILECTDTAPEGETIVGTAGPEATTYEFSGLVIGKKYSFRIKVVDNVGWESEWVYFGEPSETTIEAASLCAPDIDETPDYVRHSIEVKWTEVDGALWYDFQAATDEGFATITDDSPNMTATSITVNGTDGQKKWFRVRSRNHVATSDWSALDYTTFDRQPPEEPDTFARVTPMNEPHPTFHWSHAVDTGSGIDHYVVVMDGDIDHGYNIGDNTTWTWPGAALGTGNHILSIVCYDKVGNFAAYDFDFPIDTLGPSAPVMTLLPEYTPGTSCSVSWSEPEDQGPAGVASYIVQSSTSESFTDDVTEVRVVVGVTGTEFRGLTPGTTYYYRIAAVDNAGNIGGWSNVEHSTQDPNPLPAPVMAVEPRFTQGLSNTVSWGEVPGADKYHVQCSTDSTFTTITDEDEAVEGTYKTFGLLGDGTTYYYRVRAIDTDASTSVYSVWSNVVSSTQDNDPPSPIGSMPTITPLLTNGNVLTYQWQTAVDEVSGIGWYRLELSYLSPDGDEDTWDALVPGDVTTYTESDVSEGRYMLRARGIDKVGNEGTDEGEGDGEDGYWSPWSLPAIVDRTAPVVPTMVTEPTYTPGTSNTVSWGAVTDIGVPEAVSGLAGYDVQMSTSSTFPAGSPIQSIEAGVTSATFTGLTPGQVYYYRVRAKDAAGNVSEWSDPVSSTQDASGPIIMFINPELGSRHNLTTGSTIIAEIVDSGAGLDKDEVWLRIDDGAWVAPTAIVGDIVYYVVDLPFADRQSHVHWVTIMAKDLLGNASGAAVSFELDIYREGFGFGRFRFPED